MRGRGRGEGGESASQRVPTSQFVNFKTNYTRDTAGEEGGGA